MGLLLLYGFLAIFFSFLCSILEAVLLSVSPTFINVAKAEKRPYAKGLELLKKDVDKPLIAILTLNTIAHTVGAILVGEQAGKLYAETEPLHFLGLSVEQVTVVSVIMTILVLVVSEIIPKTIGATYWKKLAGFSTTTLNLLVKILKYTGILWLMMLITRLFGGSAHDSVFSRADFTAMADAAEETGALEGGESTIIKNLMHLEQLTVNDIMTPRVVMINANQAMTLKEFYEKNRDLRFSRIPVFETSNDHITGYVLKDEILQNIIEEENHHKKTLKDIRREIIMVNSTDSLDDLFTKLTTESEHIATVIDDYGSVVGLVTMEDVVETLLGTEIVDEFDNIEDLQKFARNKWKERAKARGLINEDMRLKNSNATSSNTNQETPDQSTDESAQ